MSGFVSFASTGAAVRRRARVAAALAGLGVAGVVALAAAPAVRADALDAKSDLFLKAKKDVATGWVSVVLQLDGPLTTEREAALAARQADTYRNLPLINAVAVRVPRGQVAKLADLPFVTRLSEDVVMQKRDEFTVASSGADVAFSQYNATGAGVTIAVLDSGVKPRPDLNGRIVANVSFINDGYGTDDPCGHGTHVAGLAAGNGAASTGSNYYRTFYGIARAANIANVRVLGASGQSDVSTVIAGIN